MGNSFDSPRKYLYFEPSNGSCTADVLIGYCPDTLGYYERIFKRFIKPHWPKAKRDNATGAKVNKSDCVYGFTVVSIPVQVPTVEVDGKLEVTDKYRRAMEKDGWYFCKNYRDYRF